MKKKFIPVAQPDLTGNEKKYLLKCLSSGWISSRGEFIEKFEKKFAEFIGVKHAISCANGTAALHLALVALGIGKGDEVLVPDLTFIASANVLVYTGAQPVLVDVERENWNINPEKIEEKISLKTKAIIVVHLYGHPANMNRILPLAKKHKLFIIEDAAEAHGAEINCELSAFNDLNKRLDNENGENSKRTSFVWKKVGSIGDIGCFSFYGNKIITTGEGGMVVTNNDELAKKIRVLRDHGQVPTRRYYYEVIGFNYRMTNLQAAVGLAQLERIGEFLEKKRRIAQTYNRFLKDIPGIILPPQEPWAKSVYWMYSILIKKPFPKTRDKLIEILMREKIECRPFFYPLHTLPPYFEKKGYPVSTYLSRHGLNLPSSTLLKTSEIKRITQVIRLNS